MLNIEPLYNREVKVHHNNDNIFDAVIVGTDDDYVIVMNNEGRLMMYRLSSLTIKLPAKPKPVRAGNVDLGGDQWHDERPGQGYPQG